MTDYNSISAHWNRRYVEQNTPWDSGRPSQELQNVLTETGLAPCRALELGCGTGTNAIYLAQQGFDVSAIDCSELALDAAREKARSAGVTLDWHRDSVLDWQTPCPFVPFPFVFDRGCYHCARRDDLPAYLATLDRVTSPGSRYLVLTGNANEQRDHGPPGLHESQIRTELGALFDIEQIRAFHFEDPGGVRGPLGWSCLLVRR